MSYSSECLTCGCSAEKDKFGDRICFCDTCKVRGGCFVVKYKAPGCLICGCSAEKDSYGDKICYCDSCKNTGCKKDDTENKESIYFDEEEEDDFICYADDCHCDCEKKKEEEEVYSIE